MLSYYFKSMFPVESFQSHTYLWKVDVSNQVSYVKLYILGILLMKIIWPAQNSAIITRNSRLFEEAHMYNTNSESIYFLFLSY